jgi:DNA repair protein RecO (recombination protein O)
MRAALQPAFILHHRPYRDTSLLLEVFTPEQGRLSLVAKSARRRARGGSNVALLQAFSPLLLSFSGRSELKTMTAVEPAGPAFQLRGERVYSGMYMNELLVRLLHRHDPHPQLFAAYGQAVEALVDAPAVDAVLRRFELTLLHELGYSIDFSVAGDTGDPVVEDGWYGYEPDRGLVARRDLAEAAAPLYAGKDLLRLADGDVGGPALLTAKRLLRQVLSEHLGQIPLRSRDLFRARRAREGSSRRAVPQESVGREEP